MTFSVSVRSCSFAILRFLQLPNIGTCPTTLRETSSHWPSQSDSCTTDFTPRLTISCGLLAQYACISTRPRCSHACSYNLCPRTPTKSTPNGSACSLLHNFPYHRTSLMQENEATPPPPRMLHYQTSFNYYSLVPFIHESLTPMSSITRHGPYLFTHYAIHVSCW